MAFQPLISLGLTVQDGGHLLSALLNSVLAQKFQNFELIILDNASTDQTEAIANQYVVQDSRIRYYRQAQAKQEIWNRNHLLNLATGTYFKFITFDEAVIPNFLERYVELLRDRGVELSQPRQEFPLLTDAPDDALLSQETLYWHQEPEEWLSEKINQSNQINFNSNSTIAD